MITETIHERLAREDRETIAGIVAKTKVILIGAYLASLIALLLACVPAAWSLHTLLAQHAPPNSWQCNHWACVLWLAFGYIVLSIIVRILIRFRKFFGKVAKFFGKLVFHFAVAVLLCGFLSLFFGHSSWALIPVIVCWEMYYDWKTQRERHADNALDISRIGSGDSGAGSTILSLTRGQKHLLRASADVAMLGVWVLLFGWYQADAHAHLNRFIAPEAPVALDAPTPTPAAATPVSRATLSETLQTKHRAMLASAAHIMREEGPSGSLDGARAIFGFREGQDRALARARASGDETEVRRIATQGLIDKAYQAGAAQFKNPAVKAFLMSLSHMRGPAAAKAMMNAAATGHLERAALRIEPENVEKINAMPIAKLMRRLEIVRNAYDQRFL
jgi:hypothetical protein